MSFESSSKTKKILSERIGIPYDKLIQMNDEEIEAFLEKKIGKKITWPKEAKIDGLLIETMEDVNNELDEVER